MSSRERKNRFGRYLGRAGKGENNYRYRPSQTGF